MIIWISRKGGHRDNRNGVKQDIMEERKRRTQWTEASHLGRQWWKVGMKGVGWELSVFLTHTLIQTHRYTHTYILVCMCICAHSCVCKFYALQPRKYLKEFSFIGIHCQTILSSHKSILPHTLLIEGMELFTASKAWVSKEVWTDSKTNRVGIPEQQISKHRRRSFMMKLLR